MKRLILISALLGALAGWAHAGKPRLIFDTDITGESHRASHRMSAATMILKSLSLVP